MLALSWPIAMAGMMLGARIGIAFDGDGEPPAVGAAERLVGRRRRTRRAERDRCPTGREVVREPRGLQRERRSEHLDLDQLSDAVAVTIDQATTTLRITSSANPAMIGGGTLTVSATPATATGVVAIQSNGVEWLSCTLAGGSCSVPLSSLAIATYTFTATYGGDANHLAATAPAFTQVIAMGVRAAASNGSGSSSTTSISITVPASTRLGDVLVAAVTIPSGTLTISGPAGWTRLGTDVAGATGTLLQSLWWKAATATDAGRAATWTFSGSIRSAGVIYAVAGATTSLPGAEQYKSSANPFSVAVINTPTLSLGATRTGIAVVFGAMQSGSSELSVGTGYSIPSSGGCVTPLVASAPASRPK